MPPWEHCPNSMLRFCSACLQMAMARRQAQRVDAGQWLASVAVAMADTGRPREALAAAASHRARLPATCSGAALSLMGRVAHAGDMLSRTSMHACKG